MSDKVLRLLQEFHKCYCERKIIVAESVSGPKLFAFKETFEAFYQLNPDSIICVTITPDCNGVGLHQLILEACYLKYAVADLPKTITLARRKTWSLLQEPIGTGHIGLICVVNAENLLRTAWEELQVIEGRYRVSLLLGFSESYCLNGKLKANTKQLDLASVDLEELK